MKEALEAFYCVGDEVTINKIPWKVKSIRHRFGKLLSYDMYRTDGIKDTFTIETGSLETLMEDTTMNDNKSKNNFNKRLL